MPGFRAEAPLRRWILAIVLGIVLVILNTWPLALRLDRIGRADSFDGQYGLWQAAWVARALVTDPLNVYDANIFFPHRMTLAFSEPALLAGILGLPAFLLTGDPYATHNLAVLGFFLLSFLSAYSLGRQLTGETLPSVALGISYAFCPYVFARTAQLPMLAIFGLPLALLAMHRLIERPSLRTALAVAGALFLQALACGYYTVFALLIVGAGVIYFGLQSARWTDPTFRRWCAAAALLTIGFLLPLFWPHIRLAQAEGFSRPLDEAYEFAADWRAWLASSAWAHRWMLPWLGTWNEVLFPGFLPSLIGLAGAWLGLRGRLSGPAGRSARPSPRALAGYYVLLAALAGWLAAGPRGGLYTVFYETIPVFSFIRAAGRFGVIVTLAAGVLMALTMGHWSRRVRNGQAIVGLLTIVLGTELLSAPRPGGPRLPESPVYRRLAEQPRGPVIEFPMFPRQLEQNARYVLMSTAHWQPLVNGYGAFWPEDIQRLASDTRAFPSEETFRTVRDWGVRYVVVHPELYERHGLATKAVLLPALDALEPHMKLLASDRHVRLYEVRDWRPRRPEKRKD
jgi:hypothetical protein